MPHRMASPLCERLQEPVVQYVESLPGGENHGSSIVVNAVGPKPQVCDEAVEYLLGKRLDDEVIAEVAKLTSRRAKPLDNTDHVSMWRKKMIRVEMKRALESLRGGV